MNDLWVGEDVADRRFVQYVPEHRAGERDIRLLHLSAGELVLDRGKIMVAYAAGGQPLDKDGFPRIVLSGETGSLVPAGEETSGRSVSNISSVVVRDAASKQDSNLAR